MRRDVALGLAASGLALCLVAAGVGSAATGSAGLRSPNAAIGPPPPAQSTASPGTLVLNGPGDVGVVPVVYEPGQTSGWHAHSGIHAVAVLSGELTVYDGASCQARRVRPGEPYVGGQELHLVRNETATAVDMIVTYLNSSAPPPPAIVSASCPGV